MFKYFNKIKALNKIFEESDHPRDEDGKFTYKGKGAKFNSSEKSVFFSSERLNNLKKIREQEINSEKANDTFLKELDSYIEKYEANPKKQKEYDKNFKGDKEGLKEYAKSPLVSTFLENPKLEFEPMPKDYVDGLILIHQSPSYMGVRGSAYYLDYEDGKLYYVRDSDHWGNFSTNSSFFELLEKYPEEKMKYKNGENSENILKDIEKINGWDDGTLSAASKHHFWKLKGADTIEEQRQRRVGRVLIKDFKK